MYYVVMNQIPEQLIIQACKDLQARADNSGDWPNGVPQSFSEICKLRGLQNESLWIIVVENIVRTAAIKLVAERLK